MIKKIFVGMTITLVLAIGVFGLVKTIYAQEEPETLAAHEPENLEFEAMIQNGFQNGDDDPLLTQTRTRLLEVQEGDCDESCEPQQLQQQLGVENTGVINQVGLGDGECDGTCEGVPQQLLYNDGTKGQAQRQQISSASVGVCDGAGMLQGRGKGANGK